MTYINIAKQFAKEFYAPPHACDECAEPVNEDGQLCDDCEESFRDQGEF